MKFNKGIIIIILLQLQQIVVTARIFSTTYGHHEKGRAAFDKRLLKPDDLALVDVDDEIIPYYCKVNAGNNKFRTTVDDDDDDKGADDPAKRILKKGKDNNKDKGKKDKQQKDNPKNKLPNKHLYLKGPCDMHCDALCYVHQYAGGNMCMLYHNNDCEEFGCRPIGEEVNYCNVCAGETCDPMDGTCHVTDPPISCDFNNAGEICDPKDGICKVTTEPVDCVVQWGEWSDCTLDCGGGTQSRTYDVTVYPQNGGAECPDPEEQACNTHSCGCEIDIELSCNAKEGSGFEGVACTELEGEDRFTCTCDICVTELLFAYTANACGPNASPNCVDHGSIPNFPWYLWCEEADGTRLFEGYVSIGEVVTLGDRDHCLPPQSVQCDVCCDAFGVFQTLIFDTSCDGRGDLDLLNSYGSLDFIGYTCEQEDDTHNCFVDVEYNIEISNIGGVDMTLSEITFDLNDEVTDLTDGLPEEDRLLVIGEELTFFQTRTVERCVPSEYDSTASVVAETDGPGGPPCHDEEEILYQLYPG